MPNINITKQFEGGYTASDENCYYERDEEAPKRAEFFVYDGVAVCSDHVSKHVEYALKDIAKRELEEEKSKQKLETQLHDSDYYNHLFDLRKTVSKEINSIINKCSNFKECKVCTKLVEEKIHFWKSIGEQLNVLAQKL